MYDIKIYEDGRERETIRGLTLAQSSSIQSLLDRHDIVHNVKRIRKAGAKDTPDWQGAYKELVRHHNEKCTCSVIW